jgi:hypothetical protein
MARSLNTGNSSLRTRSLLSPYQPLILMQTEVLLNIIHNYRFVDAPTSLFDIFQICILPNCGVMAVKSFRYDFRRIDIINDPVSILLTRRSEYYYFVTL